MLFAALPVVAVVIHLTREVFHSIPVCVHVSGRRIFEGMKRCDFRTKNQSGPSLWTLHEWNCPKLWLKLIDEIEHTKLDKHL